eukprot:30835-Pelagococcus_subviridis.AAC.7
MGGEMRLAKSLRNGVHHADGVVWGPVYKTRLTHHRVRERLDDGVLRLGAWRGGGGKRREEKKREEGSIASRALNEPLDRLPRDFARGVPAESLPRLVHVPNRRAVDVGYDPRLLRRLHRLFDRERHPALLRVADDQRRRGLASGPRPARAGAVVAARRRLLELAASVVAARGLRLVCCALRRLEGKTAAAAGDVVAFACGDDRPWSAGPFRRRRGQEDFSLRRRRRARARRPEGVPPAARLVLTGRRRGCTVVRQQRLHGRAFQHPDAVLLDVPDRVAHDEVQRRLSPVQLVAKRLSVFFEGRELGRREEVLLDDLFAIHPHERARVRVEVVQSRVEVVPLPELESQNVVLRRHLLESLLGLVARVDELLHSRADVEVQPREVLRGHLTERMVQLRGLVGLRAPAASLGFFFAARPARVGGRALFLRILVRPRRRARGRVRAGFRADLRLGHFHARHDEPARDARVRSARARFNEGAEGRGA